MWQRVLWSCEPLHEIVLTSRTPNSIVWLRSERNVRSEAQSYRLARAAHARCTYTNCGQTLTNTQSGQTENSFASSSPYYMLSGRKRLIRYFDRVKKRHDWITSLSPGRGNFTGNTRVCVFQPVVRSALVRMDSGKGNTSLWFVVHTLVGEINRERLSLFIKGVIPKKMSTWGNIRKRSLVQL